MIPNKDHTEDLNKCVTSILEREHLEKYQIIVLRITVRRRPSTHYEELEAVSSEKWFTWDGPFNYSAINNFGAKYADGDYLLLLNNDTEVITQSGWRT